MRLATFVDEARKNPEVNPKRGVVEELEKYKNDPDIYISFTELEKVGINPKYNFNTPLGIYFYPLKEVWEDVVNNSIPFAGERPWVYVVRAKGLLNLDTYNEARMTEDIIKLTKEFKPKGTERDFDWAYEDAKRDSKYIGATDTRGRFIFYFTNNLASWGNHQPVEWSRILRKVLGYTGVRDTRGVVHKNEPIQAIIFSTKGYKVLDKIRNVRPSTVPRRVVRSLKEFYESVSTTENYVWVVQMIAQIIKFPPSLGLNGSYSTDSKTLIIPGKLIHQISDTDLNFLIDLANKNPTLNLILMEAFVNLNRLSKESDRVAKVLKEKYKKAVVIEHLKQLTGQPPALIRSVIETFPSLGKVKSKSALMHIFEKFFIVDHFAIAKNLNLAEIIWLDSENLDLRLTELLKMTDFLKSDKDRKIAISAIAARYYKNEFWQIKDSNDTAKRCLEIFKRDFHAGKYVNDKLFMEYWNEFRGKGQPPPIPDAPPYVPTKGA